MIVHQNTLISLDVIEEEFVCNLSQCKGACCVEGDFGAPLEEAEIEDINRNLEGIKPYMTGLGRQKLEQEGFHEKDIDGDLVTKCIKGRDCIFAISEAGVYKCAIEKAYENGHSDYKKPISCHLYPIRISAVGDFEALNYNRWDVCSAACHLGQSLKVPVFKFLKGPLIRKYGQDWYDELEAIADNL